MLMSGLSLTTGHVAPLKHMSLLEKWSFFKSRALKKALAWESCRQEKSWEKGSLSTEAQLLGERLAGGFGKEGHHEKRGIEIRTGR